MLKRVTNKYSDHSSNKQKEENVLGQLSDFGFIGGRGGQEPCTMHVVLFEKKIFSETIRRMKLYRVLRKFEDIIQKYPEYLKR